MGAIALTQYDKKREYTVDIKKYKQATKYYMVGIDYLLLPT